MTFQHSIVAPIGVGVQSLDEGGEVPRSSRQAVPREIAVIRRSVRAIDQSLGRISSLLLNAGEPKNVRRDRTVPQKRTLSPKRRAQLKLQGSYIGYIRQLSEGKRAEVRRLRERKGIRVAINKARQLARKSKAT